MMTDNIDPVSELIAPAEDAETSKSLLPLALAIGAAAAIIMTILTLI